MPVVRRQAATGTLAPKPATGGRARHLDAAAQAWLTAYVRQHLGATLAEVNQAWQASGRRPVGQTCSWQVLDKHGLRRKKSPRAAARDTERVLATRHQPVAQVCTRPAVARFHLLDETDLRLDYARTHGRAVGGRRVGGAVPLRRGPSLTLSGALNQRSFALYVAHRLAPTLRPGDVLVLDNLTVHKSGGLREWLAERGAQVLFLPPPYSPDFSPTEQAWSKLKTKLRTCAARSYEALQETWHEAIDWIISQDAQNWFDHCGYHTEVV